MLFVGFVLLMLADPVFGAVKIANLSVQNGVNEVQNTDPLNEPLMKFLLLSIGVVFFLGLFAILKCGGASFLGMTIGTPHSAAAGLIGMVSCLLMGIALTSGIALYLSWM